jgi:RNA polymerase sigma-70 factor, ECF subfamily
LPPATDFSMEPTEEDRSWFENEAVGVLPDLYGTALRLTRNETDAEDLVSDCVVRAWSRLDQLENRARFRGWVFRILMNTFISSRRARSARPIEQPLPGEGEEGADFSLFDKLHQPFLLWWSNPEQAFLDRLLREDLKRAVDELPESFRMVVLLVDLQGFSYAEAAETLEIPIGTVRSRLSRGRGLLQQELWEHGRDADLVPRPPGIPTVDT